MTKIRVAAVGSLAALVLVVAGLSMRPSRAQEPATARVSNVSGRLAVRGGQESAVSYLQLNSVVGEGDTFWTDTNGQAEIELARGAWFRLAQQTKVEILSLRQAAELRLWQGSLYCQVKTEFGRVLTVRTPDGDVAVRPGSVARIELGDQAAGVRVYYGQAEVLPLGGSPVQLVRGQRCRLVGGQLEGAPAAFDTAPAPADPFDQYQSKRAGYLATYRSPSVLTQPLIGSYELAGRGDWVREGDQDYWIPDQEPDWRPYSDGYWSYVDDAGPVWVDDEPWGYTTSHYGRWDYLDDREQWGWVPDDDWGANYVAWGGYEDDYVGWAPLGPDDPYDGWGARYDDLSYWDGGGPAYDYWTFAPRDDFYYSRAAFASDSLYLSFSDISYGGGFGGFRPYRDFYRECGIPRYAARGLTVDYYGYAARDTVFRVESRFPRGSWGRFQDRFGFAPDRDLRWARSVSPVERFHRFRGQRFAGGDILRGRDVDQWFNGRRSRGPLLGDGRRGRGGGGFWNGGGGRNRPFWDGGGRRRDRITNLAAYTPQERQFRESRRQARAGGGRGDRLANRFLGDAGRPFAGRDNLDRRALRSRGGGRRMANRFLGDAGRPFARGGPSDDPRVRVRGQRGDRNRVASLPIGPDGTRRNGRGDRLNGRADRQQRALGGQARRAGGDRFALGGPQSGGRSQRDFGQNRFNRRSDRAAAVSQRDFGRGQRAVRQAGRDSRQARRQAGAQRGRVVAGASAREARQAQAGRARPRAQDGARRPQRQAQARQDVGTRRVQGRQAGGNRQAQRRVQPQRQARQARTFQARPPRQAQAARQQRERAVQSARRQPRQRVAQARPQRQRAAQARRPQRQARTRADRPERQAVQRRPGGSRSRISQAGFQLPNSERRRVASRPQFSRPQRQAQPERQARPQRAARPSFGGGEARRQRASRPSFGGMERQSRPQRMERQARPQRMERQARPQRIERQARPQRMERQARPQRIERQARPQRIERQARPQRIERQARPERVERPQRQPRASLGGGGGGQREGGRRSRMFR